MKSLLKRTVALGLMITATGIVCAQNPALEFNGISDCVELTTSPAATELTSGFTVEAWAYPTTSTAARRIISNYATAPNRGWGLGMTGTRWRFTTFGIKDYDAAAGSLEPNKWTHIAVTLASDNTATFYKNGQLLTSITHASPCLLSTHTLNLGRRPNATEHWMGRIDEVRVWNTIRTPQQIADNMYGSITGSEPGLVAYYPLNEGSGTAVTDLSPQNGDGVTSGAAWVLSGPPTTAPTSADNDSLLYP